MITAQHIADILNDLHKADPKALQCLQCLMIPHNGNLVEHPSIVVRESSRVPGDWILTFTGLLQGFAEPEGKVIAESWSDETDENGVHTFLGYIVMDLEDVIVNDSTL